MDHDPQISHGPLIFVQSNSCLQVKLRHIPSECFSPSLRLFYFWYLHEGQVFVATIWGTYLVWISVAKGRMTHGTWVKTRIPVQLQVTMMKNACRTPVCLNLYVAQHNFQPWIHQLWFWGRCYRLFFCFWPREEIRQRHIPSLLY